MGDQVQAAAAEGSGLEWTCSKRSDVTAARWRMALSSGAGVSRSGWARDGPAVTQNLMVERVIEGSDLQAVESDDVAMAIRQALDESV